MQRYVLHLPSLYGDHHVIEVRRILSGIPGIVNVFASSAFHSVEFTFDPAVIDAASIISTLAEAGYSDQFVVPTETRVSAHSEGSMKSSFRHSIAYRQVGSTISFAQNTSYLGRPLWPCPGMGVIKGKIPEEDIGDD